MRLIGFWSGFGGPPWSGIGEGATIYVVAELQVGLVGLGKMGANMARRWAAAGVKVYAGDPSEEARASVAEVAEVHATLAELVAAMPQPRVLWAMVPAGEPTQAVLEHLADLAAPGDVLVDGGNSDFRDTMKRAWVFGERGLPLVDVGVSGGVWGLENGYCLMAGGTPEAMEQVKPLLVALAPAADRGWGHVGPSGSGHFSKMVHNGVEYGMMQALGEGFALLHAKNEFGYDLAQVAEIWREGSVVRSWLLDLTAQALHDDQGMKDVAPVVADSGEGRWTVREAIEMGVPAPVTAAALMARQQSQGHGDYSNKLLSKMRNAFGGHAVTRE